MEGEWLFGFGFLCKASPTYLSYAPYVLQSLGCLAPIMHENHNFVQMFPTKHLDSFVSTGVAVSQ